MTLNMNHGFGEKHVDTEACLGLETKDSLFSFLFSYSSIPEVGLRPT